MKRSLLPILLGLSMLAATAGAGHAQDEAAPDNDLQRVPQLSDRYGLITPRAQAAAHVSRNASFIAVKGFRSVTSPSTGQFCLQLRNLIVGKTVPMVSVEWSYSSGTGLLAYWDPTNSGCPGATRRTINIVTQAIFNGVPGLSNDVAFVVVVP